MAPGALLGINPSRVLCLIDFYRAPHLATLIHPHTARALTDAGN